jgi:hypothetical protein
MAGFCLPPQAQPKRLAPFTTPTGMGGKAPHFGESHIRPAFTLHPILTLGRHFKCAFCESS